MVFAVIGGTDNPVPVIPTVTLVEAGPAKALVSEFPPPEAASFKISEADAKVPAADSAKHRDPEIMIE